MRAVVTDGIGEIDSRDWNAGRLVQLGTPRELVLQPADAYVERLMDTPRRQARAVDDLLELPER